jgi:ATP-dependent DNA ligase
MKAQPVDSIRPGDWIYEIKFDGYRALAMRRESGQLRPLLGLVQ